jgi:POT family proton-dependent oligopeptide transporter
VNDQVRGDVVVPATPLQAPGGTLWGFPKGVLLLSFTEMWERFSYFGMLALLVLFLTSSVAAGGFGWPEPEALKLYGLYSALAFTVPLVGGWIANNFWGERRCILLGGILIASGHALLAGPKVVPHLAGEWLGVDLRNLWISADVTLGRVFPGADLQHVFDAATAAGVDPDGVATVYRLIALSFFGGLGLIITGTALLKPTISSIVGRFYSETDQHRDSAFALFLVGIYLGEISGVFISGFLGERIAWHWGFSAAGIGMTIGLLVYISNQRRYLADLGRIPVGGRSMLALLGRLSPVEIDRIKVIFIQAAFTAVYSAAVFQNGGLLTLFAREHIDRLRWGWEIPASWFMMITSIFFVFFTPVAARYWERLTEQGRNPKTSVKLAWGLIAVGLGYVLVAYVMFAVVGSSGGKASPVWLIVMYLFMGVSEVLVWTGQLSLCSRLAPTYMTSIFVGGWYVNIGVGTWLTGHIGALGYTWGVGEAFAFLAVLSIVSGAVVWAITPWLTRRMHGIEG